MPEAAAERRVTQALFGFSLVVAVLGAAFTYMVLRPAIGFDDANITQAYARHIAQGHGYVYNIGGERVEGSTSLLWTGINVAAFYLFERPERVLAGISFLLATLTIFTSALIARRLSAPDARLAPYGAAAIFLIFPGFFGWVVWSLMDMVLWVCLITWLFYLLTCRLAAQDTRATVPMFVLASALLPITRPEGIAVTTGLALLLLVPRLFKGEQSHRGLALVIGLSGLVSALAATLWRLSYFGYPVPNTFYAKTAPDFVGQLVRGIKYILSYLKDPQNILLVVLVCLAMAVVWARGSRLQRGYSVLALYLMIGGGIVYAILGGDHFGSHRFFLYFIPLAAPLMVVCLALMETSEGRRVSKVFLFAPFVLIGAASAHAFKNDNGDIAVELAIAVEGRQRGARLNEFPGAPVVGVITAGGVRMAYDGPVQDLLGLNWTQMAHAPYDGQSPGIANHDSFNQTVFWQSPPDIFVIHKADCPQTWQPLEGFLGQVSDEVSGEDRFREFYHTACYQNLVFHVAKSYVAALEASGTDFPFLVFEAEK